MSTPRPPKPNRMISELDHALGDRGTADAAAWTPGDQWFSLLEEVRLLVKKHEKQTETIRTLMANFDFLEELMGDV